MAWQVLHVGTVGMTAVGELFPHGTSDDIPPVSCENSPACQSSASTEPLLMADALSPSLSCSPIYPQPIRREVRRWSSKFWFRCILILTAVDLNDRTIYKPETGMMLFSD